MIVVRALQGLAGGVLIPLAFTIIMTKLPRSKHPVALAMYSIAVIFAPSIGPALGGYFSDNFGWQSIFFLSVPPGLVMIAMLWYALEPSPPELHLLREDDWFESSFITRLAVIAVVSIGTFIYVELRRRNPLLHLRLLAQRNFGLGTL